MAQVTVLSYKDVGAPQIIANNRTALYGLMDSWMVTGYNQKFVRSLFAKPDRSIVLEYAEPHGYKTGHLLKVTGATNPVFNKKFRVVSVTSDTVTLRQDKEDTDTFPSTDASLAIQTCVAPADWEKVYSGATQRTYRSKADNTRSSGLYYTFKEPMHKDLKTKGACCYSVDISKGFDIASGAPLNSVFDAQKSTTFGTNYYVVTDTNTAILTTITNGRCGTWLPWFVIATDTFVYFTVGAQVHSNSLITDPNADTNTQGYRDYFRSQTSTTYAVKTLTYFFGDFVPKNTIEYLNKTSAVFNFSYMETNGSISLNLYNTPSRNNYDTVYNKDTGLVDTYMPQGQITNSYIYAINTLTGGVYSGGTDKYTPYPMINSTGLILSNFCVFQFTGTTVNNINHILRGTLPEFLVYVGNYYTLPSYPRDLEGNPFILEPTGDIYDDFLMLHFDGSSNTTNISFTSSTGWKFFKLD